MCDIILNCTIMRIALICGNKLLDMKDKCWDKKLQNSELSVLFVTNLFDFGRYVYKLNKLTLLLIN